MENQTERGSALLDTLEISSHLEKYNYPSKALTLYKNCGSPSNMFMTISCGCSTRVIDMLHTCNKSFCLNCSKKRIKRLRRRFEPFMRDFPNTSTYKWRFLTISPKNYEDYHIGKQEVLSSWRNFIRRNYIKERIKGGFSVLEVTKHDNGWHFHIHAIIYSTHLDNVYRGKCLSCNQSYLKQDPITKKFYCANRSCNKIFMGEIQQPKIQQEFIESSGSPCFSWISQAKSQSSVLNYMLKYLSVVKDSFSNIEDFAFHIANSYHDRPINAFGIFYSYKKQIKEHSYRENLPRCKKCGEVFKFSFDPVVSFIILESRRKPDPPKLLPDYFSEKVA